MARKGYGEGEVSKTGNATSHPGAVSTVDLKKKKKCTTLVHFIVILYLIELPRGLNC